MTSFASFSDLMLKSISIVMGSYPSPPCGVGELTYQRTIEIRFKLSISETKLWGMSFSNPNYFLKALHEKMLKIRYSVNENVFVDFVKKSRQFAVK